VVPADKGTGKKQDIKITGASTLGSDEVDRMVKDAEQNADQDKKQREAVDTKNQVRCTSAFIQESCMQTRFSEGTGLQCLVEVSNPWRA